MLLVKPHSARQVAVHLWESLNAKIGEWAMAAATFGLGYTLIEPAGLEAISPTYAVFVMIIGPAAVGLVVLICGAARLILLGINGSWNASPYPRALAAGMTSLFWLLIFFGFYLSAGFHSYGTWLYLIFAMTDFVNVTRSMRDAAASVYLKNGRLIRREDGTLVVALPAH